MAASLRSISFSVELSMENCVSAVWVLKRST